MNSALDPLRNKNGDQKVLNRADDRRLATSRAMARFSHPYLVESLFLRSRWWVNELGEPDNIYSPRLIVPRCEGTRNQDES